MARPKSKTNDALSVAEAARALGLGTSRTYILIYERRLEARMVNGRWLVSTASIEKFKKQMTARNAA